MLPDRHDRCRRLAGLREIEWSVSQAVEDDLAGIGWCLLPLHMSVHQSRTRIARVLYWPFGRGAASNVGVSFGHYFVNTQLTDELQRFIAC
jgi:hypothetical protein